MIHASVSPWWLDTGVVRRLWRGIRLDTTQFTVGGSANPDLLELVAEPFESVEDVADRLGELEARLVERADRRCVFLTVYTEMTAQTAQEIAEGAFDDSEWMRSYLVRFAEYYRRAFRDFEIGRYSDVPDPWIVAFGTAIRGDALVVQDAFLGINAHIVYDLALTLSDVGLDPNRESKYADHRRVDDTLARLVAIQRELLAERYAPGLSRVGENLAGLDDRWSASALRGARETAWRAAVVRTGARWRPVEASTDWLLSRTATGGASLLLSPTVSPLTMRALHDVEANRFDLASYARAFHDRSTVELP
ncbi:hypothetical protein AArcSl_2604 [Halalkaliarchaeum desulfuricum]|uniref:Uncharacterized protein n=1 Tax=Halalkaliarchaeum desulfuricum TaxID=2055893 RepID=A0A343TMA1_9EURY|nr:DUF5995 family protein [Halalkaliarchaeum desulfuricum]AUX10223.1 hypothetical protein AArcSl_2604 [Halalkaliarchaeum desulfuricum]